MSQNAAEDYLNELFAFEVEDEQQEAEKLEKAENKEKVEVSETQAKCQHPELYNSICVKCEKILTDFEKFGRRDEEDVQYREYALLGKGKGILIKQDVAPEYIENSIQELFTKEKLVLVLDLDNTLVHTRALEVRKSHKSSEDNNFWKVDALRSIYGARMKPWSYEVKCRPFLKEFMLKMMENYQIYFYTAGIRAYGKLIMQIIKDVIGEHDALKESLIQTFKDDRLIGRDDNERFQSQFERSVQSQNNHFAASQAGGDSTLKMNVFKSLKALAGDHEEIFVILDDREDVWLNEYKELPQNLLRIPGYFYYPVKGITERFQHIQRFNFEISRKCDLDLTLLTYSIFLKNIHNQFFRNFAKKSGQLKDVRYYVQRNIANLFSLQPLKLNFDFFSRTGANGEYVLPQYELALCSKFGQAFSATQEFEDEDCLHIVGDEMAPKLLEPYKNPISIFWLYMSCELLYSLPVDPFKTLAGVDDCPVDRYQSLQMECLKLLDVEAHQLQQLKLKEMQKQTKEQKPVLAKREQPSTTITTELETIIEVPETPNKIQKIEIEAKETQQKEDQNQLN